MPHGPKGRIDRRTPNLVNVKRRGGKKRKNPQSLKMKGMRDDEYTVVWRFDYPPRGQDRLGLDDEKDDEVGDMCVPCAGALHVFEGRVL
ncbi:hypothetical protein TNCV_3302111 [Trichonephila clavipes]|nr:hypothetical protein TNCV_3302111 [Trichonephila clavipes]